MNRLSNKVTMITGAGTGIGEACALAFAAEGAKVVVCGHRQTSAERVRDEIKAQGGEAIAVSGEIQSEADVKAMVEAALDTYGRIDVLHNNAALTNVDYLSRDADLINMDPEIWDLTMAVNVRGPALMSKHVVPHMIKQGGGSVIFSGSGRGIQGEGTYTAYGTSKGALLALSAHIAAQYGKKGVRSNVLMIGFILTPTVAENLPERPREILRRHLLVPFFGETNDVAQGAIYLASDESRFMNGHKLFLDGGTGSPSVAHADFMELAEQAPA